MNIFIPFCRIYFQKYNNVADNNAAFFNDSAYSANENKCNGFCVDYSYFDFAPTSSFGFQMFYLKQ